MSQASNLRSEEFLRISPQFQLGALVTEASHPYSGAWWPPGHILGYEHTFVHAVHDFLIAIERDTVASPNFKDGVYELAVMEAIERSSKGGKWEKPRA